MIPTSAPKTWVTGEQITPEAINRNFLAAQQKFESFAEKQWRQQNIIFPVLVNSYFFDIPVIAGVDYIIDRITVFGTYAGSKTIRYGKTSLLDSFYTDVDLPADGNGGEYYIGTIFPSLVAQGSAEATNNSRYYCQLFSGGSEVSSPTDTLAVCISIRTRKGTAGQPYSTRVSDNGALTLIEDLDVLSATTYNDNVTLLTDFRNAAVAAAHPVGLFSATFSNITNGISAYLARERICGSKPLTVREIAGRIQLASAGAGGQTVTIRWGFGTASNSTSVSVAGQTEVNFASGVLNLTNNPRTDDFIIEATTNGATAIQRIFLLAETIRP